MMLSVMIMLCGCGQKETVKDINTAAAEDTVVETTVQTTTLPTEDIVTETINSVTETVIQTQPVTIQNEITQENSVDFQEVLDNTIFVGDSITSGFGGYQKVDMGNVIATLNVGPSNVKDYSFEYNGNEYAALTILNFEQPENIVISMGLNDINTYSPEKFSELYINYVDDVMAVCENSDVYIFSVTPVSTQCGNIKNATIDAVNEQLKKSVYEYGSDRLHYVDCNSGLKGSNGYMNDKYSGGDGIHLSSGAYDVILEAFRNSIS